MKKRIIKYYTTRNEMLLYLIELKSRLFKRVKFKFLRLHVQILPLSFYLIFFLSSLFFFLFLCSEEKKMYLFSFLFYVNFSFNSIFFFFFTVTVIIIINIIIIVIVVGIVWLYLKIFSLPRNSIVECNKVEYFFFDGVFKRKKHVCVTIFEVCYVRLC